MERGAKAVVIRDASGGMQKLNRACGCEQFPLTKGGSADGAGVVRRVGRSREENAEVDIPKVCRQVKLITHDENLPATYVIQTATLTIG